MKNQNKDELQQESPPALRGGCGRSQDTTQPDKPGQSFLLEGPQCFRVREGNRKQKILCSTVRRRKGRWRKTLKIRPLKKVKNYFKKAEGEKRHRKVELSKNAVSLWYEKFRLLAFHKKTRGRRRKEEQLHHPGGRSRREVAQVLLLSPPTLRLVAPPGEAHDHGHDDGDLHGADDGGDEDVVQLLSTGDNVQDVEVQELVALRAAVGRITPAGRQVVSHLTLAVFTELVIVFRTGGGAVHKSLPLARLGHSINVWFGLHAVVLPAFILATADVFDVDLQLFEAGRLSDVTRRVVRDAVAAAHRVVVVSVTHDVTHAEHVLRVFVTLSSKLAISTF